MSNQDIERKMKAFILSLKERDEFYQWLKDLFGEDTFKGDYNKADGAFYKYGELRGHLSCYEDGLSLRKIFRKLKDNDSVDVLVRDGGRYCETTLTKDNLPKVKAFGANFKTLLDFDEITLK